MAAATTNVSPSLSDAINSNNFNLSELDRFLSKGTVQTYFWGSRCIEVSNDSVEINRVARRLLNYVVANEKSLNEQECRAGLSCISKMRQFYQISDEMILNSNFITRIVDSVKSFLDYLLQIFGFTPVRRNIEIDAGVYTGLIYNVDRALEHQLGVMKDSVDPAKPLLDLRACLIRPASTAAEIIAHVETLPFKMKKDLKHLLRMDDKRLESPISAKDRAFLLKAVKQLSESYLTKDESVLLRTFGQ